MTDRHAPWNAGRWRLRADHDGSGAVSPSQGPADLSLDVAALGSAYLGRGGLEAQRRAGLIGEHTPGAVRRLDRALRTDLAPRPALNF